MGNVEVDEEPDFRATEFQVRQDLRFVDRQQLGDGLHFDDDAAFDEEIDSVACVNRHFIVDDRKQCLGFDGEPGVLKLVCQTHPVGPLQKTWTQTGVHAIGESQDLPG
jgi:hypothetical protein